MYKNGDRVYHFGTHGYGPEAEVTHAPEPDGRVAIRYEPAGPARYVMASELYPYRELDADVQQMTWAQLQDEVMKLRGYFRWILDQRGDDLCWRDFYVAAAACLPGAEGHRAQEALSSCHPRWLMLGNCDRFITSLKCGEPYTRLGEPALTPETAKRPAVRMFDVMLRVHRSGGLTEDYWTATGFSPAAYGGSFRCQKIAHDGLTRLLVSLDHYERTGVHLAVRAEEDIAPVSSLTPSKG